jgi:hypothetical protein
MVAVRLSKNELEKVKGHVEKHSMTLALVRTEHAPIELGPMLRSIGRACKMSHLRTYSSSTSDFGIAELNSNGKMLIVLFVGGACTELLSVSETDEAAVKDLEDNIHSSNFLSEIIRMGL